MKEDRVVTPEANASDLSADFADGAIRPMRFEDFIGQRAVCENLKIFIKAAGGGVKQWITYYFMVHQDWGRRHWLR